MPDYTLKATACIDCCSTVIVLRLKKTQLPWICFRILSQLESAPYWPFHVSLKNLLLSWRHDWHDMLTPVILGCSSCCLRSGGVTWRGTRRFGSWSSPSSSPLCCVPNSSASGQWSFLWAVLAYTAVWSHCFCQWKCDPFSFVHASIIFGKKFLVFKTERSKRIRL